MNRFHLFDWIVLVAYFGATMGIGFYFYKRTRSTDGYTAANRSLPGWVCGLSIFATYLSSISYLALPGKSFASNWNPFVFALSIPLATYVAVRWFVPYYRKGHEVSAYALLEKRFGLWARVYASIFYLLTQLARISVVMYLMALPLQVIFGWDIYTILIFTGICVTVYSLVGGLTAVIWADAIQALVLMAGAVICLLVMFLSIDGGASHVIDIASQHDKFSLGSLGLTLTESTFWVVLLYGVVMNLQNFGIDQSYIQRYIAPRSLREAKRGLWLGSLLYIPMSALFFLIGTTLFVQYEADRTTLPTANMQVYEQSDLGEVRQIVARQRLLQEGASIHDADFADRQEEVAASLQLSDIGDRVFPHFIAVHLPPGLTGLLIAAIFAAAMSTVSTSLNSSATLLMSDYYKRFFRPQATEKQTMRVLYSGTFMWGVLGTGLSLLLVRLTQSALDMWWILAGIFGGGVTGLFLLGMISRTAKNASAVTGVIVGIVAILWLSAPQVITFLTRLPATSSMHQWALRTSETMLVWSSPFHAYMIPVFGTLVILLIGMGVSSLNNKSASRSRALSI